MSVISMSKLGHYGRWGNMLIEYAALKAYAVEHGCELQVPDWPGKFLFGLDDPPVTINLPPYREQYDTAGQPIPPSGDELVGHDFQGYAQWHTRWWSAAPCRMDVLRRTLSTEPPRLPPEIDLKLAATLKQIFNSLFCLGITRVGIHIRKGDYGRSIFYLTPIQWYLDWLREWWPKLKNPVLYLASEDPADAEAFAEYDPWTATLLGLSFIDSPATIAFSRSRLEVDRRTSNTVDLDFLPDWLMLSYCDYLVTGNSTFSFSAGMVSFRTPRFFRASLPASRIIEENLWNTYPLHHDKSEDYRRLPGVCVDETPYWIRLPNGQFREK